MPKTIDAVAILLFALTQAEIARFSLRTAQRQRPTWVPRLAVALAGFYLVFLVGLVLGISQVASRLGVPPRPAALLGAAAYAWALGSMAAYMIYRVVRLALPARSAAAREDSGFDPLRRRLLQATGGALVASPFGVLAYGALVQRTDFRVREVTLPIAGLPDELAGLRLVQVSDIHLSAFLSERELARAIDAANETRAHIALVTGDLISVLGDPLDACLRQLARLRSEAGIFGCLGNHEVYAHAQEYATRQGARLGIRFLRHAAHALRFGAATLNLAGVDYQPFSARAHYLPRAERLVAPGALNVLLSHNPDVFPVAARKGYNLTLSGHTHGGQVTVEILDQAINPARFFTPYIYGLYRAGDALAYVTRGIGTIGLPARIGAPPEVSLLTLQKG